MAYPFGDKTKPPVKLTDDIIVKHLAGEYAVGVSPFFDNENVLFGGIDLDVHPPSDLAIKQMLKEKFNGDQAKCDKYIQELIDQQQKQVEADIPKLLKDLTDNGYLYFLNSSGSLGKHLRVYSNKPISGKAMRYFLKDLQVRVLGEERHEVFPKQDRLDEKTPYGNQMKLPLAIHPRTGNLAGVIVDDKILSREESLDFFVQFAEMMDSAKPIDFEVTGEIEQKLGKKKISPEQLEMMRAQGIPEYCGALEEVACKQTLMSGKATRHDYLDGNAYQYLKDKPELFNAYKTMQGRDDSAFNNADEWVWSCGALIKFGNLNDDEGAKKIREICLNCPYKIKNQKFVPLKRVQEYYNQEIRTKVRISDYEPGIIRVDGYNFKCKDCENKAFKHNFIKKCPKCDKSWTFQQVYKTGTKCYVEDPDDKGNNPIQVEIFLEQKLLPKNREELLKLETKFQQETMIVTGKVRVIAKKNKENIVSWYIDVTKFEFYEDKFEVDSILLDKYKGKPKNDVFWDSFFLPKIFGNTLLKKILAIALCSPLKINLPNGSELFSVPTINIFGDPGQVKTISTKELLKYTGNKGMFVSVENARVTGLIAGNVRGSDSKWRVKLGQIPRANGKLLVLDGYGNLEPNELAQLRGIIEEHRFEVSKIARAYGECAVRMLCLGNLVNKVADYPSKHIASYDLGVSMHDKKGKFSGADRRRADHLIIFGEDDTNHNEINRHLTKEFDDSEQIDYWKNKCNFAWQLRPDQINWEEDITGYILNKLEVLNSDYSAFPLDYGILSKGQYNMFIKQLPAVAIMLDKIDKNGIVDVDKDCVDFLTDVYDSEFVELGLNTEIWRTKYWQLHAECIYNNSPDKLKTTLGLLFRYGSQSELDKKGKQSRSDTYRTLKKIITYEIVDETGSDREINYCCLEGSGNVEIVGSGTNEKQIWKSSDDELPPIQKRDGTLTDFGKMLCKLAHSDLKKAEEKKSMIKSKPKFKEEHI